MSRLFVDSTFQNARLEVACLAQLLQPTTWHQAIASNSGARPPLKADGAFIFHGRPAINFSAVNRRLDIRESMENLNRAATARVPTRNVGEIRQQDRWSMS
jgi:hypothetical protein